MSWDCRDCQDTHPGRFGFCPVSGRPRAQADTMSEAADRAALELADQLEAFVLQYARGNYALASNCRMCADHLRSTRKGNK